ncbi:hypothetical protein OUZ56_007007 [Daphnia magna]|uniref:Uncharacterized protein n=1 Tax=Daphnia magna TaxID=35525 RepID=A0ABQ9YYJ9_9CRUS|nr:hypothetical protein OUZ56_007007 [Daphnia magna]
MKSGVRKEDGRRGYGQIQSMSFQRAQPARLNYGRRHAAPTSEGYGAQRGIGHTALRPMK